VIDKVSTVDGSTAVRVCAGGTCGPKFMDRSMDQFETWRRLQNPRRPAALHAAFPDAYTADLGHPAPATSPRSAPPWPVAHRRVWVRLNSSEPV
jgi:hypothetical protein